MEPEREHHIDYARGRRTTARFLWALILIVMIVVVAVAAVTAMLLPRALAVQEAFGKAIPLLDDMKGQVIAGDTSGAEGTARAIHEQLAVIDTERSGVVWQAVEYVPWIGPNLTAAEAAAESIDTLMNDVMLPATDFEFETIRPSNAAFDTRAIESEVKVLAGIDESLADTVVRLEDVEEDSLFPQVSEPIAELASHVRANHDLVSALRATFTVLPEALGATSPKTYVVLLQNNAELRTGGGTVDGMLVVRAEQGVITVVDHFTATEIDERGALTRANGAAPSGEPMNARNLTSSPNFAETAARAAAAFEGLVGESIDGVIALDIPALERFVELAGPVTVGPNSGREVADSEPDTGVGVLQGEGEDGGASDETTAGDRKEPSSAFRAERTIAGEEITQFLVNDRYFMSTEIRAQEESFSVIASAVIPKLLDGRTSTEDLTREFQALASDGRLRFSFTNQALASVVEETGFNAATVSGVIPEANDETTVLGVAVNDASMSKLGTFLTLELAAASTQCDAEKPEFSLEATLTSTLLPEQVGTLGWFISPGLVVPRGDTETDVLLYGPAGATLRSVTLNGEPITAEVRKQGDLDPVIAGPGGRAAAAFTVHHSPGDEHVLRAVFDAPEAGIDYGPLRVQHTPLLQPVETQIHAPGCEVVQ